MGIIKFTMCAGEKIPRIIHYVWVGDKKMPERFLNCVESFKKFNPDFEVMEWNEKNSGLADNEYVKTAVKEKNWAFISDIIRLAVLDKYGGIYLDTDAEVVKPLDEFLKHDFFIGYESGLWLNGAVMGCVPGHEFLREAFRRYLHGKCEITFSTNVLAVHNLGAALKRLYGAKLDGKTAEIAPGIMLYASDWFFPQHYLTGKTKITENTHIIHHYWASWHSKGKKAGASFAKWARIILGKHVFGLFERIARRGYLKTLQKEHNALPAGESAEKNAIEVKNLNKAFGEVKAVDDLSFTVKKGSFFAFLGLNGAGKSTTINILCSILKKDSGTIFVDGLDLDRENAKIKDKIGIVFQNSVLDPVLSVKQNLYARASLYGMSKKAVRARVEELSSLFNLKEILKRRFGVMSGGQKRRVDIARALLHSPSILFLDEPTTGLDPTTRVLVWKIIEKLRKETGLTIFLTTHYMEEAVKADKVIILDGGKITAEGSPDELKGKYTTDFVRVISGEDKAIEALLAEQQRKFEYKQNSYYVQIEGAREAIEFIEKNKEIIKDFEVLKGDMDDVFLNVTGKKLEVV